MKRNTLLIRLFFRAVLPVTIGALPFACGSSVSDPGQSGSSLCAQMVSTICNKIAACNPNGLRSLYGDASTCVSRLTSGCSNVALSPGTSWNDARIDACVKAYESATCGAFEEPDDFIPECNSTPGSLADGARCFGSDQCAGGACEKSDPASPCGTCAQAPSRPGCGGGAACVPPALCATTPNGARCILVQPEGAACSVEMLCGPGLLCKDGICSKGSGAGAPCVAMRECDRTQGLLCIDMVCQLPAFAPPGAACDGQKTLCSAGAECRLGIGGGSNVCVAPAADGASCDNGVPCLLPAQCKQGICQVVDGSQCR